jgi:hypothetical protein
VKSAGVGVLSIISSCVSGRILSVHFDSANKYGGTDMQGFFDHKLSIKAV